jgi:catechol 1,2-dioxygenase
MSSNGTDAADATFGKAFTENVVNSMGPKTSFRLREVMSSLIRHVHDFAREVDLTIENGWLECK